MASERTHMMRRARRARKREERKRLDAIDKDLRDRDKCAPKTKVRKPSWYSEYLKTPHWKNFKARWRRAHSTQRKCCICGDPRYELHHRTYDRIGVEEFSDVVPLCRPHHARAHRREKVGIPLWEAHLTRDSGGMVDTLA